MTQRVPQHGHCSECGDVIPSGEDTCGDECQEEREARRRKQKRWLYLFYGAMAVGVGTLLARMVL